jgi:hypothetical protein
VNSSALLAALVPAGAVTRTSTGPALAAAGLAAVICVPEFTMNNGAGADPKSTAVAPVKPEPVTVTRVPPASGPLPGLTAVTTGGCPEGAGPGPGTPHRSASTWPTGSAHVCGPTMPSIKMPPSCCAPRTTAAVCGP